MKKKLLALLLMGAMVTGVLGGCGGGDDGKEGSGSTQDTGSSEVKDAVIVTMPASSEPAEILLTAGERESMSMNH